MLYSNYFNINLHMFLFCQQCLIILLVHYTDFFINSICFIMHFKYSIMIQNPNENLRIMFYCQNSYHPNNTVKKILKYSSWRHKGKKCLGNLIYYLFDLLLTKWNLSWSNKKWLIWRLVTIIKLTCKHNH